MSKRFARLADPLSREAPSRIWKNNTTRVRPTYSANDRNCRRLTALEITASPRSPCVQSQHCVPSSSLRRHFKQIPDPPQLLRSGLHEWALALLAAASIGALLSVLLGGDSPPDAQEGRDTVEPLVVPDPVGIESAMTGEALPGRPGTLTPEQEEKLRELWHVTLKVFGVIRIEEPSENGVNPVGADNKKPKKKLLGLFRNNKSQTEAVASAEITPSISIDDKYGSAKEFQEVLASHPPELIRATFWGMVKHDHPDALLLRFLRARKWDVNKALSMMIATMKWRATEIHVDDDIIKVGELGALEASQSEDAAVKKAGEDFLVQMRLGKSFLHGLDKSNRPICFVRVRLHRAGEQSEESVERYTVYVCECARLMVTPPVDTAVGPCSSRNLLG